MLDVDRYEVLLDDQFLEEELEPRHLQYLDLLQVKQLVDAGDEFLQVFVFVQEVPLFGWISQNVHRLHVV